MYKAEAKKLGKLIDDLSKIRAKECSTQSSLSSAGVGQSGSTDTSTPTIHNHYYNSGSSSFVTPVIYPSPNQTTVINNYPTAVQTKSENSKQEKSTKPKEKTEEKKETNDPFVTAVTIATSVGITFLGTYIIAEDEYVALCLSDVEKHKQSLAKLFKKTPLFPNWKICESEFDKWMTLFVARTRPSLMGKASVILSALGLTSSAYLSNAPLGFAAAALGTVGGCHWLWKHLTCERSKERSRLDKTIQSLTEFRNYIVILDNTIPVETHIL